MASGLIAQVLSIVRATRNGAELVDVKSDPGGGDILTPEHYGPAGDDSLPLVGDSDALLGVQGTGRAVVVGYADTRSVGVSLPGEVRRYSRDLEGDIQATFQLLRDGSIRLSSVPGASTVVLATDGSIVIESAAGVISIATGDATLMVDPDGTISGTNDAGNFELEAGGDFGANGAKMTTDGDVQTSDGISLRNHTHGTGTYTGDGDPVSPGPLGGGVSGVPLP